MQYNFYNNQMAQAIVGAIWNTGVDVINISTANSWTGTELTAAGRASYRSILNDAIRFLRGFNDVGRDGVRAIVDADGSQGNGRYDGPTPGLPGEPYADRNGNGRFDPGDGVIIVAVAGNDGRNRVGNVFPAAFAPDGIRVQTDPLVLSVSATGTVNRVTAPEQLADFSNYGNSVALDAETSVSAMGEAIILPRSGAGPLGAGLDPSNGTSFAAPQVAGLAAEMIFLDKNTRAPANRLTPLQIIEIIEATAEDLGSNAGLATNNIARPNDNPGNGLDPYFGHGRINVWKAILAVINQGIAEESHQTASRSPASHFPSLRTINEENTHWYGFKIITSVRGASAWLGNRQLTDNGAQMPQSPSITAYKGVRSDQVIRTGVPNEDPTSGIVPVGNRGGEYIMTFSIQRSDLLDEQSNSRTLSLRQPGQTAADNPYFKLKLALEDMRNGSVPGVVFDDFVFEITAPDFGDAPIFLYPVGLVQTGAYHVNTHLEWFGGLGNPQTTSVSPEFSARDEVDPDQFPNCWDVSTVLALGPPSLMPVPQTASYIPDLDAYDDGILFFPSTYQPGQTSGKVVFTICVADPSSGRYSDLQTRSLYVNGWIDWNKNWAWEEKNSEHVVNGVQINPASWTVLSGSKVQTKSISASGNSCSFEVKFAVSRSVGSGELWARFRLDYGENVGRNDPRPLFRSDPSLRDPSLPQTASQIAGRGLGFTQGAARFGEVEDYCIDTISPTIIFPGGLTKKELAPRQRTPVKIYSKKDHEWYILVDIVYLLLEELGSGFSYPSYVAEVGPAVFVGFDLNVSSDAHTIASSEFNDTAKDEFEFIVPDYPSGVRIYFQAVSFKDTTKGIYKSNVLEIIVR